MNTGIGKRYLNIDQAAEWLNIPRGSLAKLVTARQVQHTRFGKHVRFSEDDLAAYGQACKVLATPAATIHIRARRRAA